MIDFNSLTWLTIKDWAEKEIAEAQSQFENLPGHEAEQRARIKTFRDLLSLKPSEIKPMVAPRAPRPDKDL